MVVWAAIAPNIAPKHSHIRVLIYRDPGPVINHKRLLLKHCGVGASSVCGKEFHRWQHSF